MSIQSIIVLSSVPLVAVLAAARASARGVSPGQAAQQIIPALLVAAPIAAYAFALGPEGHAALQAGLAGVLLATLAAALRVRPGPLAWADICAPAALLGVAATSLGAAVAHGLPAAGLMAALWQVGALAALLRAEGRLSRLLRPGDVTLLAGALATPGALLGIAAFAGRYCLLPQAGVCQSAFSGAPLVVMALGAACALALALRHLRLAVRAGAQSVVEG